MVFGGEYFVVVEVSVDCCDVWFEWYCWCYEIIVGMFFVEFGVGDCVGVVVGIVKVLFCFGDVVEFVWWNVVVYEVVIVVGELEIVGIGVLVEVYCVVYVMSEDFEV